MPLYKATVIKQTKVEIAISANSKEEAENYLKENEEEWSDDASFDDATDCEFVVLDVSEVTHPRELKMMDGDCYAYNADSEKVADIFYNNVADESLLGKNADEETDECDWSRAYGECLKKSDYFCVLFDQEKLK